MTTVKILFHDGAIEGCQSYYWSYILLVIWRCHFLLVLVLHMYCEYTIYIAALCM